MDLLNSTCGILASARTRVARTNAIFIIIVEIMVCCEIFKGMREIRHFESGNASSSHHPEAKAVKA
jgi:hypothetical protein